MQILPLWLDLPVQIYASDYSLVRARSQISLVSSIMLLQTSTAHISSNTTNYNFDLCMDNIAHVIVIVLQSQLENLHVNLVNVRFRFVKLLPLGEVRNHFSLDMKRDKVDSLSN